MDNKMPSISLFYSLPPNCDCCEEDAKVQLVLPEYGKIILCEKCIIDLVEKGLKGANHTPLTDNTKGNKK